MAVTKAVLLVTAARSQQITVREKNFLKVSENICWVLGFRIFYKVYVIINRLIQKVSLKKAFRGLTTSVYSLPVFEL